MNKTERVLSGRYYPIDVICPKCSQTWRTNIEVEHVACPVAWRINEKLAIICPDCGIDRDFKKRFTP